MVADTRERQTKLGRGKEGKPSMIKEHVTRTDLDRYKDHYEGKTKSLGRETLSQGWNKHPRSKWMCLAYHPHDFDLGHSQVQNFTMEILLIEFLRR